MSCFCCQTFYPHLDDDMCSLFDTQISRFRVQRFVKRQISAGSMADSLKRYPINWLPMRRQNPLPCVEFQCDCQFHAGQARGLPSEAELARFGAGGSGGCGSLVGVVKVGHAYFVSSSLAVLWVASAGWLQAIFGYSRTFCLVSYSLDSPLLPLPPPTSSPTPRLLVPAMIFFFFTCVSQPTLTHPCTPHGHSATELCNTCVFFMSDRTGNKTQGNIGSKRHDVETSRKTNAGKPNMIANTRCSCLLIGAETTYFYGRVDCAPGHRND